MFFTQVWWLLKCVCIFLTAVETFLSWRNGLFTSMILDLHKMYVPGTLENINTVLVDIGTGYFAEKVRKMVPSLDEIFISKHVGHLVLNSAPKL